MFRPARPVLHWLLWLVIALLPLRGWAMAQMAVTELAPTHAQSAPHPACHEAADLPPTDAAPHAGCTLCEVCHAGLAPAAAQARPLPTLPHAPPAATEPAGPPEAPPSALFRPPRR
ncbi:hypothetical protein ACU6VI_04085 [Sphaerotilus natans]|uniref:hypothetical protein n=1 Tax=Sphaerotilus natans TaxID=34103 RepID=UPI00406D30A2